MTSRTSRRPSAAVLVRTAAVSASAALVATLVAASPAMAAEGLGTEKPSGLSELDTFLLFVGIPVLVFAVVIALVYGLSRNSEPRLREGQSWWTEPDFNTRESLGTQDHGSTTGDQPRTTDGGGTGASW